MNTVSITGVIVTQPDHDQRCFTHTTEFDIELPARSRHRHPDRFHVVAHNQLAVLAARLRVGACIAITGFLRSEPFDMPDRSIWHRVEVVAFEIDSAH